MKSIIIATKNPGKFREFADAFAALPIAVEKLPADLPDAPERGQTFAENAADKAIFYAKLIGRACLADDSGLCVDALDGAPGVMSARYSSTTDADAPEGDNNKKLIDELKARGLDRSAAHYECALVLADENGVIHSVEGRCHGTIKLAPHGEGGFGYDPYFYIDENTTMADLPLAEKQKISHRGRAVKEMRAFLMTRLKGDA